MVGVSAEEAEELAVWWNPLLIGPGHWSRGLNERCGPQVIQSADRTGEPARDLAGSPVLVQPVTDRRSRRR